MTKRLVPPTAAPTFFRKSMVWVGSEKPLYIGSFWKYRSEDGKVQVRAWPAQKEEDGDHIYPPEICVTTTDGSYNIQGRYNTHKELLRVISRAESDIIRRFKQVSEEYHILRKVTQ